MTTRSRFATSLQLLRTSLRVIKRNPKLLIFPFVSLVMVIVIMLFYICWSVISDLDTTPGTPQDLTHFHYNPPIHDAFSAHYLFLTSLYVVLVFIATFMNVAFYHETFRALDGDAVSLLGGLQFARQRLRSIILWALFACSVGILLKIIASRLNFVGRIVTELTGVAWSVAAIFVIPTMIRDKKAGPITLLRNSGLTVKKTWGESIIGFVGFQGVRFCLVILGIGGLAGATLIAKISGQPMFFVAIPIFILILFISNYLMNIASGVYRGALYIYATEGVIPEPFTPEMMDAAWKVKKS